MKRAIGNILLVWFTLSIFITAILSVIAPDLAILGVMSMFISFAILVGDDDFRNMNF